jgi:hypothetical protein
MTQPVFLPQPAPKDATPWAFLSWGSAPLHGVARSPCPRPLDRGYLPWGSASLQRSRWRESTSCRLPGQAPWLCQGVRRQVPSRRLRRRSQVFPTSQRLVPLSALPPFSDGWRSWDSPFRGRIVREAPTIRHRRRTLMTFLPQADHPPFLGGGTGRRSERVPRMMRLGSFTSSSGSCSSRPLICATEPGLATRQPICPSWAFASSWFAPPQTGSASALRPSRFTNNLSVARQATRCAPRLAAHEGGPSLAR